MAAPKDLLKEISAGKFRPAYYFYGSEDYRIAEAVKFISRQFLPKSQQGVNYCRIDGRKTKAGDLITQLSNFPMLGEKQVFVVNDFQSYKPTEIQKILPLLAPPDPNRIVIFASPSARTPKKNSAFYTAVSKYAEPVEFNRLTFDEAAGQIKARLQKEEINISSDALRLLTELLGGNRGALEGEVSKLLNYKQAGETVEIADIKAVSTGYEVYNMFELGDMVISGQAGKVLQMIRSLLSEGKTATFLTSLLQQHFASLYLVKNGKKPTGNRSFLLYKFKPQAQKYDNPTLERILIEIADADRELRHAGLSPEVTLEKLALSLCRAGKA